MSEKEDILPKKTLETTLTVKDIQTLKRDGIFTKKIFVTTLILKYKPRKYKKKT